MSTRTLEELDRILDGGGEPDDALRKVVSALVAEPGIAWAGIAFIDRGALALGPAAGEPDEDRRIRVPIAFHASNVGELWIDGVADRAFLERVAALLSSYVLIGWDTSGETWEP